MFEGLAFMIGRKLALFVAHKLNLNKDMGGRDIFDQV